MRAEDLSKRREKVREFEINIVSYQMGDTYHCAVDNVSPGAVVARGAASTREEAERVAVEKARQRVGKTKIQK